MIRVFALNALVLVLAGCATPLPQVPPAGIAARVDAPRMKPGDTWRYAARDGYTSLPKEALEYRVAAIAGDTITMTLQHGDTVSAERYTRDLSWIEKPMTNLQDFRYSPPYPALPFPLEAGKKWHAYVQATDPATGRTNRVRIDGEVLGWERVTVPAGVFDTLKVHRLVYAGNHDFFRGEEHIRETDWYAPQIGKIVKQSNSSEYLDMSRGCDDAGACTMWVNNDWTVLELVRYDRGADRGGS